MAKAGRFKVGVVIIPIRAQAEGSYPHAEYQTRARAIAESLGLFVVDPLPEFLSQPDRTSLFIPVRSHSLFAGRQRQDRARRVRGLAPPS